MTVGTMDEHILGCIDRFAASEVALRRLERAQHLMEDGDGNGVLKELVDGYCEIIELPTADVKPVAKGKWSRVIAPKIEKYWCSECKGVTGKRSNFCPNCGADMRKEANDD